MKRSLMVLVPMLLACGAVAQTCPFGELPGKNSSGEFSLGVAVAAIPGMEAFQQEKAPPDSVFVDVQPTVTKKVNPVYPKIALAAGIEGVVYVRVWIDDKGKVHDVKIIKSDQEVLNQSAIDAARQFEFAPATVGGKPVSVWVSVPFRFKIADKAEGTGKNLPVGLQGTLECIMTLLSEKDVAKCKTAVAPNAFAIIGRHYVPLSDAIERRGTPRGLPDEHGWQLSTVHSFLDDGAQVATLVLRTVQKKSGAYRFHTIVCVRSGEEEWKIRHWHVGQ